MLYMHGRKFMIGSVFTNQRLFCLFIKIWAPIFARSKGVTDLKKALYYPLVVNDKTYPRTLFLVRKCLEAIRNSNFTINPPKTYFWKEKIISIILIIFSFDQKNVSSLTLCQRLSCYNCFKCCESIHSWIMDKVCEIQKIKINI